MARLAGIGSREVTNCGAPGFHMLEEEAARVLDPFPEALDVLGSRACLDRAPRKARLQLSRRR